MFTDLLFRLRSLVRRHTVEDDLDEELSFHLEGETEKLIRTGLAPAEAPARPHGDRGCGANQGRCPRRMDLALVPRFRAGRALRSSRAAAESHVYRSRGAVAG
jgi:hypothetical protein